MRSNQLGELHHLGRRVNTNNRVGIVESTLHSASGNANPAAQIGNSRVWLSNKATKVSSNAFADGLSVVGSNVDELGKKT